MKDERIRAFDLVYDTINRDPDLITIVIQLHASKHGDEVNHIISEEIEYVMMRVRVGDTEYPTDCLRDNLYNRLIRLRLTKEMAPKGKSFSEGKEPWQNKLLYYFSRFCGPANRENIQFMQRDLILESRDMRRAQHHKWFITTALTFRALFGGILPIIADGLLRLIKPVKEAKDIAKKSGD